MADIMKLIAQGKIKRYFRTREKFSFKGAISHITQHATGKELLFIEDADYLYLLYLMKNLSHKFSYSVLSFALMPNHIHILLKLTESNLSIAMKGLFQSYARYFNKKYERKGHVFSGAYGSSLCFDENYLLAASLYIHLNPVRAKLVKDPVDYRWSSCALFLREVKKDPFVDYKFILMMLNENISLSRHEYRKLLNEYKDAKIADVLEEKKALELFAERLKNSVLNRKINNIDWEKEHGLLGDEDIGKKIEALKRKGNFRMPQNSKARKFLIEQLKARGYSVFDIAQKLNLCRQSIYKILNT